MSIEALEAHLRKTPEDWTSWLVYGDWLLEHDDDRGEIIRLEHQKATRVRDAAEARTLQKRIDRLARKHQERCAVPEGAKAEHRYGFLVGIELPFEEAAANVLAPLLEDPDAHFLTSVRLRLAPSDRMEDEDVDEDWDGQPIPPAAQAEPAKALAALDLSRLTSLALPYCPIGPEGAAALAASSHLQDLSVLDLRYAFIRDEGLAAIASSPGLASVESLLLQVNRIGPEGARALASSEHLRNLQRLDLRYNQIGPEGAKALADSAVVRKLRTLLLYRDDAGEEGVRALARSTELPSSIRRTWRAA